MKINKKRIALFLVLVLSITALAGTITARANISDDIGIRWWRMNQAHDGAEICRRLGGDNEAALAYFGQQWTDANNERKDLEAQRQVSLGVFTITHYCPCSICNEGYTGTATGAALTPGETIAVDPSVIPYWSHVIINGHEYIAEDCGGGIKGNHIDLLVADHQTALAKGTIKAEVFLVK